MGARAKQAVGVTTSHTLNMSEVGRRGLVPWLSFNWENLRRDALMVRAHMDNEYINPQHSCLATYFSQFIPNKKDQPMCTKCPIYRVGRWSAQILFGAFPKG